MSIVFSDYGDGLYASEAYPALFLHDRAGSAGERSLSGFADDESCLIFCDTPPADIADFKLRVSAFRRDPLLKVAWLKSPELFDDPGALCGLRVKEGRLADRGLVRFRNHILFIHPGSVLTPGDGCLILSASGGEPAPARLLTAYGKKQAGSLQGDLTIELARHRPGRIKIDMEMDEPDLDLLDAGIRYFFPDEAQGPEGVGSMRFPVFSPGSRKLKCSALLHPLYPLRRDHEPPETLFKFSPSEKIKTYYRTPLGQVLRLTPQEEAGLVYERKMETLEGRDSDAWYLAPWGSFELGGLKSDFPALMPGAVGTEFFQGGFDGSPFYLTFRNGCSAYLPGFIATPASRAGSDNEEDSLVIENRATTSYLRFHGGLATYFAQPSEQPFYLPAGPDDSAAYLSTPFANLADRPPGTIPPNKECVPVLPLAGIDPDKSALALRLELRMAAVLRGENMKFFQRNEDGSTREVYSPLPVNSVGGSSFKIGGITDSAAPASDGLSIVTPGGYIGNFSHDLSEWRRMLITTGSDHNPFAIVNINGPLRNALQAGRRFTVISDPILFLEDNAAFENFLLNISGWGFDLDPEEWLKYGTVLLFKDHTESMAELARRPGEWTEGQYLNLDPWDVSEKLIAAGETAKGAVEGGDLDFAPFLYQIWENPGWNGFIAFNVRVSPLGFPDDLAVIAGGVDPARLMAHHVGVSTSSLERQDSGAITNGRGALFGLVDYEDETPVDTDYTWEWTVRKLRARFRNSRLQNFQARIDLGIGELFGDKASCPTPDPEERPADTIILNGHYEEHDGKGRYTFLSKEKLLYQMSSGVLQEVMLNRAGFETISVTKSTDGKNMDMRGRFLLAGHLKFQALKEFDIFSYDKIPMQNMALNLAFSISADVSERPPSEMTFSIEPMRIQVAAAEARERSLANRFPLALDSVRHLPPGGVATLKLASVVSPLSQTTREEEGFQMEYRIDLGIGIKSFLNLAWWPSGKEAAVNLGLRIPGFDGAFDIVDDLIKIGPERIQFMVNPENGEIILLFRRIGIEMPLGLSLPPEGSIDAALFGDPDAGGSGKIAWYAAWNKPG
ncbi:MAG: hypothetical protein OEV42_06665 [Deltaproteobacteria bacterium]|nr:hypothetical protein [Deltaproteobacteria bacterium]